MPGLRGSRRKRLSPRLRERHAKLQLPVRAARQVEALLLLAAVLDDRDRAEDGVQNEEKAGGGAGSRGGDLLNGDRELEHPQPAAPILGRDHDAEPAPFREGAPELQRKPMTRILLAPVVEI